MGVPVFQHAGGNGDRGMFAVGEDAYFGGTLYEARSNSCHGRPVRETVRMSSYGMTRRCANVCKELKAG